jgi:hypothetical protein
MRSDIRIFKFLTMRDAWHDALGCGSQEVVFGTCQSADVCPPSILHLSLICNFCWTLHSFKGLWGSACRKLSVVFYFNNFSFIPLGFTLFVVFFLSLNSSFDASLRSFFFDFLYLVHVLSFFIFLLFPPVPVLPSAVLSHLRLFRR